MLFVKIAPILLLALTVVAEKKIELQDIEEDNLKSEKEKDSEDEGPRSQSSGLQPFDFLKSGLLRYFENPTQPPQQPRYVHQYAVTELPERPPTPAPKPQYGPPPAQQAMVGYYSNVPMQIYLVPQYYNEPPEQAPSAQSSVQYAQSESRATAYPTAPEAVQPHANYIEVPTYVTPSGKAYIQQLQSPVAYVTYAPQISAPAPSAPQTSVAPMIAYPMPVVQYSTAIAAPPVVPKGYYHQYTETNSVDDQEEPQKQQEIQAKGPYGKPTAPEFPRYYNSRTPIREQVTDYRQNSISELPHPNPLLLKTSPPHLAHLPKALPMFKPLSRPVYAAGGSFIPSAYTPRPIEAYGAPFKRRPTSLLDSYIPSSLQVEYLKRGYTKDPLAAYEALSSGRHLAQMPRHYERGFLPNQMYHTAAGGITYGHYKRASKGDRVSQK